jgi:hypothetical protein
MGRFLGTVLGACRLEMCENLTYGLRNQARDSASWTAENGAEHDQNDPDEQPTAPQGQWLKLHTASGFSKRDSPKVPQKHALFEAHRLTNSFFGRLKFMER